MTLPHPDVHALAAAYALNATTDDEAREFERHLVRCPACQAEVAQFRETAATLGAALAVAPPQALKARVMTRIAQVRPLPPKPDGRDDGARHRRSDRRGWWPRATMGLIAASIATTTVLATQLDGARDDLERSQSASAVMRQVIEAPDVGVARAEADGAHGTVLLSRAEDLAILISTDMPPAGTGHVYQVWFIHPDGIRSAGLLDDTDAPLLTSGLGASNRIGITVEPNGGSDQPTSDPVMVIELPA
ncbi:anti-sigma factor [Jiangella alkaliphila]|uniref:Regulator of SigK n=1 Tax=Jiangella alkaliphila TaxID=419479 RepID=A0A1H2L908_9ACTN|nr:anti-sigma factor [Jiangella alkaliphila]SDU76946.1 Anti-sigma-K factor RskA [Jiangella alkaliphila]